MNIRGRIIEHYYYIFNTEGEKNMEFLNMNTGIVAACFLAAFLLGRWSVFIALESYRRKYISKAIKELSPTVMEYNIITGEVKFDQEPIQPIQFKIVGEDEALKQMDNMLKEMAKDESLDDETKEFLKKIGFM